MSTLPRLNLCGQVADNLGRRIMSGAFKPGEAVPQEENLCSEFGVSRTVVREAVKSLAAKGLVHSRPKRGTIVRPSRSWNFLDAEVLEWHAEEDTGGKMLLHLTELRQAIEPAAAAMAAERGSEEALQRIKTAYQSMDQNADDVEAFVEADVEFHTSILHATANPFFGPIANVINTSLKSSLRVTNREPSQNRLSVPLHEKVTKAILARNPGRARSAMSALLGDASDRLTKTVKSA